MIFVCGIHGVGKSFFCNDLREKTGKLIFSASDLILKRGEKNFQQKKVDDIQLNQKLLIDEVNQIKKRETDFILDGHLCLLDKSGKIRRVYFDIVKELEIDLLMVLIDCPQIIKRRVKERDGIDWEIDFIQRFQNEEIEYARKLAKILKFDYQIIKVSAKEEFGKSIVLPIKQEYAEKIFSGEKKYEYRKSVCKENIDKLYLYATYPVKKIVGECNVVGKYSMNKDKMWRLTQQSSGISSEYFEKYFREQYRACAYEIGNVKKYQMPVELKSMGINYVPQSYVYVSSGMI